MCDCTEGPAHRDIRRVLASASVAALQRLMHGRVDLDLIALNFGFRLTFGGGMVSYIPTSPCMRGLDIASGSPPYPANKVRARVLRAARGGGAAAGSRGTPWQRPGSVAAPPPGLHRPRLAALGDSAPLGRHQLASRHTHTHTHTHIYIHIHIYGKLELAASGVADSTAFGHSRSRPLCVSSGPASPSIRAT